MDFEGTCQATDAGFLALLKGCECGLIKVNLAGCINLSDAAVVALVEDHGFTLELLNLAGCGKISDQSLVYIAENCFFLVDLDVSKSGISDRGISALAGASQLFLQILSLSRCHVTDVIVPFSYKL